MPKTFDETRSALERVISAIDPAQAKADLHNNLTLLKTNLVNVCDWLDQNVPKEYRLRNVSGFLGKQLKVHNNHLAGKPVDLSALDVREGIYEQARTLYQL